jgi:hypothetical protein
MVMSQQLRYGAADPHQAMVSDFHTKAHFAPMENENIQLQEGEATGKSSYTLVSVFVLPSSLYRRGDVN